MEKYEIHVRYKNNNLKFRIWDTISESYCTNQMTEGEIKIWFLKILINDLIDDYSEKIGNLLQYAKISGSSKRDASRCVINDENWKRPSK